MNENKLRFYTVGRKLPSVLQESEPDFSDSGSECIGNKSEINERVRSDTDESENIRNMAEETIKHNLCGRLLLNGGWNVYHGSDVNFSKLNSGYKPSTTKITVTSWNFFWSVLLITFLVELLEKPTYMVKIQNMTYLPKNFM
jgi:hypothetical protein